MDRCVNPMKRPKPGELFPFCEGSRFPGGVTKDDKECKKLSDFYRDQPDSNDFYQKPAQEANSEWNKAAYALSLIHIFPQPLEEMLKELKDVDERLNLIRAQRFAKLEEKKQQNAEPSPEGASEDEAVTEETAEENVEEAPSAAETEDESAAPLEEGETGDNA